MKLTRGTVGAGESIGAFTYVGNVTFNAMSFIETRVGRTRLGPYNVYYLY